MMMRINASVGSSLPGVLEYLCDECSIYFTPAESVSPTSTILFGMLGLHLDGKSGRLLYPMGYFPDVVWREAPLVLPKLSEAVIHVEQDEGFQRGVAYEVGDGALGVGKVEVLYDPRKNILRIARSDVPPSITAAVFCSGAALGIREGKIADAWLVNPGFRG